MMFSKRCESAEEGPEDRARPSLGRDLSEYGFRRTDRDCFSTWTWNYNRKSTINLLFTFQRHTCHFHINTFS